MSEKNTCIECNHNVIHHASELIKPDIRGLCAMCRSIGSVCSRTYESLVGEKGTDGAEYWGMAVRGFVPPKTAKDAQDAKPTLQLLVIDFGDTCIVRAEKGEMALKLGNGVWRLSSDEFAYRTVLVYKRFPELREALDGEKPVPRLERMEDMDGDTYYSIEMHNDNDAIAQCTYDALSELAGKPLPVWKGGKWEEIKGGYLLENSDVNCVVELPCKIYRYTK